MLFIILTIILAIAFVISIGFAFVTAGGKIAAGAVLMLWLIIFGACSATTVSARSVGIQTGFGKYQGTLDNGFHWTNPTSSVEEFSTMVQTLKLDDGENNKSKVAVRFSGGGEGAVKATVNWQISDKEAKALWERFRTFDKVENDLVYAKTQDAIRKAVGGLAPNVALDGANLDDIGTATKKNLQTATDDYGVVIVDVTVTNVEVDGRTQESISKTQAAQQDLARAELERQKAITEAKTAEIRKNSGILSPDANMRYCLDVVNNWDQNKNGHLPAGFNCLAPGTIGVVAPSK